MEDPASRPRVTRATRTPTPPQADAGPRHRRGGHRAVRCRASGTAASTARWRSGPSRPSPRSRNPALQLVPRWRGEARFGLWSAGRWASRGSVARAFRRRHPDSSSRFKVGPSRSGVGEGSSMSTAWRRRRAPVGDRAPNRDRRCRRGHGTIDRKRRLARGWARTGKDAASISVWAMVSASRTRWEPPRGRGERCCGPHCRARGRAMQTMSCAGTRRGDRRA